MNLPDRFRFARERAGLSAGQATVLLIGKVGSQTYAYRRDTEWTTMNAVYVMEEPTTTLIHPVVAQALAEIYEVSRDWLVWGEYNATDSEIEEQMKHIPEGPAKDAIRWHIRIGRREKSSEQQSEGIDNSGSDESR